MTAGFFNIFQQLTSVRLVAANNVVGTYFNGPLNNAIDSTLTANSDGTLTVDGVVAQLNDRLLLVAQTNPDQNGIYFVLDPGSLETPWILQRAPDFQSLEQIKAGQFISVNAGSLRAGSVFVVTEPIPSFLGSSPFNFVSVADTASVTGPYLLKAANLSDVNNSESSYENLGLGNGSIVLTDSDFIGGIYSLSNPCPVDIQISCNTPGNILKLPVTQGMASFAISQGPFVQIVRGKQSIIVEDSSSTPLLVQPSPSAIRYFLIDKSTPAGLWSADSYVTSINTDLTGAVILNSGIGSVYVANDGVDAPGLGEVVSPYQTLSFALSQITDNSSTKPYTIYMSTGIYTETNLAFKPWISIQGNQSQLTVSGSVTLDSGWTTGGETKISNFANLAWPAVVTLDFNSFSPPLAVFILSDCFQSVSTTLNVIGDSTNGAILLLENLINFSDSWIYNITNCYGSVSDGDCGNITINHTSETAGGNFSILNMTELGNLSVTDNTTAGLTLFHEQCKVIGSATYTENGAGTFTASIKGVQYLGGAPTIDNGVGGGSINFVADILDSLPILLNTATYTPTSIADAMAANNYFTPSNYTPTAGAPGQWSANSVVGNLKGIDLALSGGGGNSTVQFVYIAPTGNDSTGNGTINAPLLTYEKARTYSQSLIPSPSNQFMIVAAPGQYTGMTDLIYDPWVHLSGENAYFQGSGSVIQDGFIWGNNNNQSFSMIGPNLVLDFAGSLNFDMTGVTPRNNIFILQGIRYINISGFTAKGVGTSTWYVKDVRPMSVTQTGSNPPFVDFSFQDCYGEISDCTLNNLSYNLSAFEFESESLPFQIKDCTIHSNWSNTGVSGIKTASIEATGNAVYGTISASGSDIFVDADVGSVWSTPVITSGATFRIHGSTGTLIAQQLWVNAASGSDVTGNGNINNPLASFNAALTIAEANATSTNQYLIHVIGDQSIAGDFSVFPYVNVDGHLSGVITCSGAVITNIAWSSQTSGLAFINNCRFVAPGGMLINFGAGSQNTIYFDGCDFGGVVALLVTATNTNTTQNDLFITNQVVSGLGGPFASGCQVQDAELITDGAYLSNLNVVCTGAGGTAGSICDAVNSTLFGTINVTDAGTGAQASLNLSNSPMSAAPQVSGVNAILEVDTNSYTQIPTFVSGATIASNLTISSLTDGQLQTSFTPVNYTPVGSANYASDSLTANLAGIDAALATAGGDTLQSAYDNGTPGAKGSISLVADNANPIAIFNSNHVDAQQFHFSAVNSVDPNSFTQTPWGYDYRAANLTTSFLSFAQTQALVVDPTGGNETSSWRLLLTNAGAVVTGFNVPSGGARPEYNNGANHVASIEDFAISVNGASIVSAINATSVSVVQSMEFKTFNAGQISARVQFTPTSSNVTIIIQPSFGTTFSATGQACGTGSLVNVTLTTSADGSIALVNSVSGQGLQYNVFPATSIGNVYQLNLVAQYTISN